MNRTFLRLGIGILIFAGFLLVNIQTLDPDLGWHLRLGELTSQSRQVIQTDTFSYTMPGYRFVNHEWLPEVFLAWMSSHHLWPIVILISTLLAFTPFLVWLWRYRGFAELWIISLLAIMTTGYLGVRHHLISFFLFFVILELLIQKYITKQENFLVKAFPVFVPLIFFVWANLHGGVVTGVLMYGLFLAAILVAERLKYGGWNFWERKFDLLTFLVSLAITFLNINGWLLYQEGFRAFFSGKVARYISEWQPALVLIGSGRSVWEAVLSWLGFVSFAGIYAFLIGKYRRSYPLPLLIANLVFSLGFLKAVRLGPFFFISSIPIFTLGFGYAKAEIRAARQNAPFARNELRSFRLLKFGLATLLIAYSIFLFYPPRANGYPEKATEVLRELNLQGKVGKIFNDYGWGGYLLWQAPEVKLFIDGRMSTWAASDGSSAMADYIKVSYPENEDQWKWREVFARHKINTVFIKSAQCNPSLNPPQPLNRLAKILQIPKYLNQTTRPCRFEQALLDEGWNVIYKDEIAVILQKS